MKPGIRTDNFAGNVGTKNTRQRIFANLAYINVSHLILTIVHESSPLLLT
ncbi:MAG: hypothetical protein GY940_46050 [bacterium]|nr:hypothetical protein [bacterium]